MLNESHTYYPRNFNRLFNNPGFVGQLIYEVVKKLGRPLGRPEKSFIGKSIQNINPLWLEGRSPADILRVLSDQLAESMVKNPCGTEEEIDVHEMLKTEFGVSTEDSGTPQYDRSNRDVVNQVVSAFSTQVEVTSLLGNRTLTDFQRLFNPGAVKKKISILLDTRYRMLDTDGTLSFQWNFINNEVTAQGTVNAIGNIRDIIALRISPLRIPYTASADNDYKRITLYIQEFSAQSFIAQENRRFHFIFSSEISGRWINLITEEFNDGYFVFRSPITRMETLTLSFGSPLEPVTFTTDRMTSSVTNYFGVLNAANYTEFTTSSDHNLETGDRVYITNFTTANTNTDAVIVAAVNRTTGHLITATGNTTFTIPVNSSSIRVAGVGTVTVSNGSPIVIGLGTSFGTAFSVGDYIEISSVNYLIASIQTHLQLTLAIDYPGVGAGGLAFWKNNILTSNRPTIYFGSKRIFVPLEVEYFDSGVN